MTNRTICLVGGTGFIGHNLVCELSRTGHELRVLTRRRERHRELLVYPSLELIEADVHAQTALNEAFAGCDAVINLVGILNQGARPNERFEAVHEELPEKIAAACNSAGVERLLHVSALGASEDAPSEYLKSKARGESRLHKAAGQLAATSFRPSVVFGAGDTFFNRFATILNISPLFVPLACPQARFAPVFVADLTRAMINALDDKATHGQGFDIAGPRAYTLKELVSYVADVRGQKRTIWGLNDNLSRLQARALELMPGKPFSYDNYLSLQRDSVCAENELTRLGVQPTSIEAVVPGYLGKADPNTRYQHWRASAGRDAQSS